MVGSLLGGAWRVVGWDGGEKAELVGGFLDGWWERLGGGLGGGLVDYGGWMGDCRAVAGGVWVVLVGEVGIRWVVL